MRIAVAAFTAALTIALCVPQGAHAVYKTPLPDGTAPERFDLAKPARVTHHDAEPPTAGGYGDGANSLAFTYFDDGDMCVVLGTATGHAGEWDGQYDTNSLYDFCLWSANVTPKSGVQREQPLKYRRYDVAYGLWVPSVSVATRERARSYCRTQNGEPYDIGSSKNDQARWYCSKLLWASYRYVANIDLDADGGYWVWPVDLVNDTQTSVFAKSN